MNIDSHLVLWLVAALLLLGSEFVALHLVSGFLGAGALVVAAARWFGLVEELGSELLLWGAASALLFVLLRSTLVRLAGRPEASRASVSDEVRLYGSEVEVVAEVTADSSEGRVRIDGTSWPATSTGERLPVGSQARLVRRESLVWIVEGLKLGEAPMPPSPLG